MLKKVMLKQPCGTTAVTLATMEFVRLKQLFVDALLINFLIFSKDSPLFHETTIKKVNHYAKPNQKPLKYRGKPLQYLSLGYNQNLVSWVIDG